MGPVGTAMQVAGPLVKGVAGYETGKFNAAVADTNATNATIEGNADALQIRDQARDAMGQQIAKAAEGGFGLTGSTQDLLKESAINAELDIMTRRRQARAAAQGFGVQAANSRAQGKTAMVEGIFGAGKALADAASKAAAAGG